MKTNEIRTFLKHALIKAHGYRIVIDVNSVKAIDDGGEEITDFDGKMPEDVLFDILKALGHKPEWA